MRPISAFLDPVRGQRWFIAGLLGLFVVVSVLHSIKVMKPRADGYTRSAINRWAPQLEALEAGENINERYNYPNPPIMALMLWPFAKLSPLATALTWFYLKVALTLFAIIWTFRMVETPEQPFPVWAKALTVLLSVRMIMSDLSHGNVNLLILFLLVGALYAFRNGRDWTAGNLLALSIACKLTPALFLAYFVYKRAWKTLIATGAGLVLYFFVVPGLFLGFERNQELLSSWVNGMVMPFVRDGVVTTEHQNQSLPGLVHRLFTASPSFSDYNGDLYVPTRYDYWLSLAPKTASYIVKGIMAIFALALVLICRSSVKSTDPNVTPAQARQGWQLSAEYSIVLIGMLLFSERTWKHHAVTLLVPFAVLCYTIAVVPLSQMLRRGIIAALVIANVGIALTSTGMWEDDFAKNAQVYGGFTVAFIALLIALFAVRAASPPESAMNADALSR